MNGHRLYLPFYFPWALSATGGLLLWTFTALASGKHEPWDTDRYWTVSYPLAILASALLGYFFVEKAWRWAVALMSMQLVVMAASGSDFSLLPLGAILLAVLTVAPAIASVLAAKLRLWGRKSWLK